MAIITSAAGLSRTELQIDAANRDITLALAGGLSADGVTLQAIYSYLKKVWRVQNFNIGAATGTSGSPTVTLDAAAGPSSEEILPGMTVLVSGGTGTVPAGTEVSAISGTTLTLSQNATANFDGSETITFVNHLIEYPFPLVAITPEQFEFSFDWTPVDNTTRKLIRTAGWREITTDGTLQKEYVGIISLGNIDGTPTGGGDTVYYAFRTAGQVNYDAKVDFTYAGPVNEAIQTFDIAGDNNRTKELALFIRQEGKTFGKSASTDIGITSGSAINYQVYRFPLSEVTDLNYTVTDATIEAADAAGEKFDVNPGNGPEILYYATDQLSNTFLTTDLTQTRPFGVIIDASDGTGSGSLTLQELYSWVKYRLRQNVNIDDEGGVDAATQIGATSDELLTFVGSELQTLLVQNADGATTPSGVAVQNFASADIGNLAFAYTGGGGSLQRFPLVSSGTISFNANLAEDATATYTMYYQYTRQYSVADLAWTQSAGQSGTLSSATNSLPAVTAGDYIDVSGFSDANLNGVYLITAETTPTTTIAVTRIDDLTLPASETQSGSSDNFRFNPVNSPDAIIVKKADGVTEIRGSVPQVAGGSSITFDYGYTNDTSPNSSNTAENRVSETSVPVAVRAVGTTKAQWVSTPSNIIQGNANNISVVAPLERNYAP